MPNPFALIDRIELDFDLPPAPSILDRADHWFNRLSELQRIGVALLAMLFLAASGLYCLGLGSTVLVNRAEAELAAQQADFEASLPTPLPTVESLEPTPQVTVPATPLPTPRPAARPTQVTEYPTPIPAQLLPSVPLQPNQQSPGAPADAARPRIVAPYEPPTPTPPVRVAAPAARGTASTTAPGAAGSGAPARAGTPGTTTPAILRPQAPAAGTARPAQATAAPASGTARPAQATAGPAAPPAARPTSGAAPILFPSTPVPKPATTPAAKPSITR